MLNNVLNESFMQAMMNNRSGIPTSKEFIAKIPTIKGTDLVAKKECQVC